MIKLKQNGEIWVIEVEETFAFNSFTEAKVFLEEMATKKSMYAQYTQLIDNLKKSREIFRRKDAEALLDKAKKILQTNGIIENMIMEEE